MFESNDDDDANNMKTTGKISRAHSKQNCVYFKEQKYVCVCVCVGRRKPGEKSTMDYCYNAMDVYKCNGTYIFVHASCEPAILAPIY